MINELVDLYSNVDIKKLELYEEIAIKKIIRYLNIPDENDDYVRKNFPTAIKVAVGDEIENSKHKNVKSYKEGEQSITYQNAENTLSDDVKSLLPCPKVRML